MSSSATAAAAAAAEHRGMLVSLVSDSHHPGSSSDYHSAHDVADDTSHKKNSTHLQRHTEFTTTSTATTSSSEQQAADEALLHEMGYEQELHRGFSSLMNFSFCFSSVAILSSISITLNYGLSTGGPAVMLYGWLVAGVGTICTGAAMAEIAATYPSAGSVYHWAGQLSSRKWSPFASFVTGWLNFIGNSAGDATYAYGCAQMISALVALNSSPSDSSPALSSAASQVGMSVAIAAMWGLKNCTRIDSQGWVNHLSAGFQFASLVVIMACLLFAAPMHSSREFVWESTHNSTGMPSMIYVTMIGMLMSAFTFSGYEAGAHLSEETHNAALSAPWSILNTCLCAFVTGFIYLVGLLYATVSVDYVLNQGITQQSVVNIYRDTFTYPKSTKGWPDTCLAEAGNATISNICCDSSDPMCVLSGQNVNLYGASALTLILILNLFMAGFSSLTVTSRIGFAMVRDNAMPGSKWFYVVTEKDKIPYRMIFLVFVLDAVMCCMPLISQYAFNAITSITTIGYQLSYAIPIILRLTVSRKTFVQSQSFNLGKWSLLIGTISTIWLCLTSMLFLFPNQFTSSESQSATTFNYTCVVLTATMAFALVYWFLPKGWGGARWHFEGPKRKDSVVGGSEEDSSGVDTRVRSASSSDKQIVYEVDTAYTSTF